MEDFVSKIRRKTFFKGEKTFCLGDFKGEKHEKPPVFHAFLPQTPLRADKKSYLKDFLSATQRILKMCPLLGSFLKKNHDRKNKYTAR